MYFAAQLQLWTAWNFRLLEGMQSTIGYHLIVFAGSFVTCLLCISWKEYIR